MEHFFKNEIKRLDSDISKIYCMIEAREKKVKTATEELKLIKNVSKDWQSVLVLETKRSNNKLQINHLTENLEILEKIKRKYVSNLKNEREHFDLRSLKIE